MTTFAAGQPLPAGEPSSFTTPPSRTSTPIDLLESILRLAQEGLKKAVALFQTDTPQTKPLIRPEVKLRRLAETAWIPIDGVVTSPEGTPETLVLLKEHSLLISHTMPELAVPVPGSTQFATVRLENVPLVSCMSCTTPFTVEFATVSDEWSVASSSPLIVTPWRPMCVAADRDNVPVIDRPEIVRESIAASCKSPLQVPVPVNAWWVPVIAASWLWTSA